MTIKLNVSNQSTTLENHIKAPIYQGLYNFAKKSNWIRLTGLGVGVVTGLLTIAKRVLQIAECIFKAMINILGFPFFKSCSFKTGVVQIGKAIGNTAMLPLSILSGITDLVTKPILLFIAPKNYLLDKWEAHDASFAEKFYNIKIVRNDVPPVSPKDEETTENIQNGPKIEVVDGDFEVADQANEGDIIETVPNPMDNNAAPAADSVETVEAVPAKAPKTHTVLGVWNRTVQFGNLQEWRCAKRPPFVKGDVVTIVSKANEFSEFELVSGAKSVFAYPDKKELVEICTVKEVNKNFVLFTNGKKWRCKNLSAKEGNSVSIYQDEKSQHGLYRLSYGITEVYGKPVGKAKTLKPKNKKQGANV